MAHPEVHDEQRLTPKGRATRDRIVQAAAELIVTEGLSASNMESVRNAASVSGSQLAHYFADKSTLIRAVIRRQIGVVLDFHRQPKLRDLDSFDDFEQWVELLEVAIQRMKDHGVLTADANPRRLALTIVCAHQGGATLAFTYRAEWPHADATRFAVNYLRMFAIDPDERTPRPARRPRGPRAAAKAAT